VGGVKGWCSGGLMGSKARQYGLGWACEALGRWGHMVRTWKVHMMCRCRWEQMSCTTSNMPSLGCANVLRPYTYRHACARAHTHTHAHTHAHKHMHSHHPQLQLMSVADVDGDGLIDYNEFVASTMHISKLEKEELMQVRTRGR